jgi:exonuclease 3'-5' domain-containing protein 1
LQAVKVLDLKFILVDSIPLLEAMLSTFSKIGNDKKQLNVDFEGVQLCRSGQICLGQFHETGSDVVYIVDFIALPQAFSYKWKKISLKSLMEDPSFLKVFFDPRNDVDALAHQLGSIPENVLCLQVAECAFRKSTGLRVNYVFGLKRVLEKHLEIDESKKKAIGVIKNMGNTFFNNGTDFDIFLKRPLSKELLCYSAIDVAFFDDLKQTLFDPLAPNYKKRVMKASKKRVFDHQNEDYRPYGPEKRFAPKI